MVLIKAVIIGFAHMHVNEVAMYVNDQPDMVLCACADIPPDVEELNSCRYTRGWNLENVKKNYCSNIYTDYIKMLDEQRPDIAFILTETSKKQEVVAQCAQRGIDVSIEKPMAMNYEQALSIKNTAERYGILALINWPLTWRPYLHTLIGAADGGIIGDKIKLGFLIGNTGPVGRGARHRGVTDSAEQMPDEEKQRLWWYRKSAGGGALFDFLCYGCMLTNWLMDEKLPQTVTASSANLATDFSDAPDNAAAIIKYNNFMAVLEGTWTTPSRAIPAGPVVYGTEGVIYCEKSGGDTIVRAFDIFGKDINVRPLEYPSYLKNIAEQYAAHKLYGKPLHKTLTMGFNIGVMRLLSAALDSSETGLTVNIDCLPSDKPALKSEL